MHKTVLSLAPRGPAATVALALFGFVGMLLPLALSAVQPQDDQAAQLIELGKVRWNLDFDAAVAKAKQNQKPLFVQFQEIPGCQTCKNYGNNPLSHPLLVDAIETEFVPALVYNNRGGKDAELLRRFNEPSWNNPVVRYLNGNQQDIIPRKDSVWTTAGVTAQTIAALEAAGRDVPAYLYLLKAEHCLGGHERATFAMHCYWEGEAKLGGIDGVSSTRSAWVGNLEVVTLTFDPAIVDYAKLVKSAQAFKCASKIFAHSKRQLEIAQAIGGERAVMLQLDDLGNSSELRTAKASDQKYYLQQTQLRFVPMLETQATKLNSLIAKSSNNRMTKGQDKFGSLLSPTQRQFAARLGKLDAEQQNPVAYSVEQSANDRASWLRALR